MKPIISPRLNLAELSLPDDRQCGLYTVCACHAASEPLLRLGARLSLDHTVRVLDCGNRADIYLVARALRPLTADPIAAMKNIRLSRAFTCYQVEALLSSCRGLDRTPVLALDFFATFMDESVSDHEIQRLFRESVAHLRFLSVRNVVMVGVKPVSVISDKCAELQAELLQQSDDFFLSDEAEPSIVSISAQLSLL